MKFLIIAAMAATVVTGQQYGQGPGGYAEGAYVPLQSVPTYAPIPGQATAPPAAQTTYPAPASTPEAYYPPSTPHPDEVPTWDPVYPEGGIVNAPTPAPYEPTPVPYQPPTATPDSAVATPASFPDPTDDRAISGLTCPSIGYMMPDDENLCFVWFCVAAGEAPIKRACPKGVRVPSWWTGGELNMCNVVNIVKHGGEPVCLRCSANDRKPLDNCADVGPEACPAACTCVDREHTHRCDCPVELGVTGFGAVEAPFNYCDPNPCLNGASCQNQWDGFFCFCPNGWTGHRCETPICDWHPCLNGGTCVVDEIGYHCDCTECWGGSCCNETISACTGVTQPAIVTPKICDACSTGPNCDIPVESCACGYDPCYGGPGTCSDLSGVAQCDACDKCFTGKDCKTPLNSCDCTKDCPANSECFDVSDSNSHSCVCNACYADSNGLCVLEDTCACNNPCSAGQDCTMVGGKPSCGCADSCSTGPGCADRINTCACNNDCPANSVCQDGANGKTCECNSCFTAVYDSNGGQTCALEDTCECNNPCDQGQQCTMVNGAPSCGCADSCMSGPTCSDKIMSCACHTCEAGKTCVMDGGYPTCTCADSCFVGDSCDIQLCSCNNPCANGGQCTDTAYGPQCTCDSCHSGDLCQDEVQSCDCKTCDADKECAVEGGYAVCKCPTCTLQDPATGVCDVQVDTCECNNPCKNVDICVDLPLGGTQCECDCTGNEACVTDRDTGAKECKCPLCFTNKAGESGCLTPVTNLCDCNNPCTGDQEVCVNGPVPDAAPVCKIGNPSSGNAFTVLFEENNSEKSFREIPLELYMTPSTPNSGPRSVNIRSAGLAQDHSCYFNTNQTVQENSVLRFPVERCMMQNRTGLERLAIRLTELNNETMIVYGINKDRWTADGFLATPDVQAGTSFQTVSYAPAHISTQFAIAALFDDTVVTIELADDNDLPAPWNTKGSVYTLTMNAFETFQVQARCPNEPASKKRQCVKDLSGSVITASNKVHVFSGNVRAFVKAGEGLSRDHLVEELLPTDRWGKKFGMVSVPGRAVGDVLNIMALKGVPTKVDIYYNGQSQTINLPYNGRLNQYVDIPSNKRLYIESDQPLSVTQLTKSKDTYLYQNETVHDPVTITIPPVEQFTNNFFISTPLFTGGENFELKPYVHNYAMMVAKKGEEGYITLGGNAITSFVMPWGDLPQPAGSTDMLVGAVIEIPHGTQLISSSGGNFQCLIYGFDDRESYGFPAAMNQAVITY